MLPVLAVMAVTDRSGVGAMTLLAALLHECGHFAAAAVLRIPLKCLKIDFLGARMELTSGLLPYGKEWLLCAAGPFASLLFAAVAAPLWNITHLAQIFSCASLVLGLVNLLPINSFDGGRMLESFLCATFGSTVAARCGKVCSFLFLFLLWTCAVYLMLRAGNGMALFCFSVTLLLRFFDGGLS